MHRLFVFGILLKGIDGILEILGGVFLFFVTPTMVNRWLLAILRGELTEDPQDFLANYVLRIGQHLTVGAKTFAAIFLVGHGMIKVILVVNLLRDKRWAYPVALMALILFIGYQSYRLTWKYSVELAGFTLLDLLVFGLIWQEYRMTRRHPRCR